ncbi:DUF4139 domain-containing protein [Kitasatospora purpeofusca]|uniref:DUF4139 domain-containing protein n=1 Tax=Kitasatospora purpeofusca TaxID=67352 RepID=UPI002A59FE1D|nr:DUF4139 domain-containing protein [Kitasatospora purpeofusca]MDY0810559.1 DUF4139 domain-containing protein [Kitasatospora purpeofusca]
MNDQQSNDQHRPQDSSTTGSSTGSTGGGTTVPTVPSVLDSVVVHAAGAVCRRRARVALPPDGRVRLTGLPGRLDERSLRARVLSGPSGTAVTGARVEAVAELRDPSELPELRLRLDAAREHESTLRERLRLVLAAVAETTALRAVPPARRRDEPLRRTPADAWLELADFVDERLEGLHRRAELLTRDIELAEHETELLADRIARATTADPQEAITTATTALLTLTTTPAPTTTPTDTPTTEGAATPELDIELEYSVQAARWVPSYRLSYRQGEDTGRLVLRASVAQQTDEDWTGVRLALSTADLERRTDLPELRSLRIGRSQPAPQPSGWREPPAGLSDLFSAYDAAGPRPVPDRPLRSLRSPGPPLAVPVPVSPAVTAPPPLPAPAAASFPSPGSLPAPALQAPGGLRPAAPGARGGPRGGTRAADEPSGFAGYGGPPPPEARRVRAAFAAEGAGTADEADFLLAGAPAPAVPPAAPPAGPPIPDERLLDYPVLELLGPDGDADRRGTLHRVFRSGAGARTAVGPYGARLQRLPMPQHAVPPRVSAGSFDHRFDAAAPADIPSDGTWHTVTIDDIAVSVRPEYVAVPAVEERVYATLVLTNGTARAVLAGPVEVTVDDEFLLTGALPTLAPGGVRRLGIGVAESVEVTRRTELHESTAGMLNNSTVLDHRVRVELANRLGRPVTVEVRERVPVSSDADVRIEERPGWHAPDEPSPECPPGTRLRRVDLPPGGRAELDGGYQIRIPAGKAIVGGNRRN